MQGVNPLTSLDGLNYSDHSYNEAAGMNPVSTEGATAPSLALMIIGCFAFIVALRVAGFRGMIAIGRG